MLKTFALATAVGGLMMSGALAQSAPPADSTTPATPPAAMTPAAPGAAASPNFITTQTADQWLASKFMGMDVIGADDQKIGDVKDMLFDRNGQVLGYVVGVGGFLGMGQKDVALAPASFQVQPGKDANDTHLKLSMTKEQLTQAAEFKPYQAPKPATVGAGDRPAGGGMGTGGTGTSR